MWLGGNYYLDEALWCKQLGVTSITMAGMRHFGTGATRDQDTTKPDYEGFISPLVIKRYGEYMNKHRTQPDGSVRASDNWQLGIPKEAYIKSAVRHVLDWRLHHRGYGAEAVETLEESICALIFNASGYLLELLKERRALESTSPQTESSPPAL